MGEEKFLEMFDCCADLAVMCGGLSGASVLKAEVNRDKLEMYIEARFAKTPAPAEKTALEARIAAVYGLSAVRIDAGAEAVTEVKKKKAAPKKGRVIFGSAPKSKTVPMSELNAESGNLTVTGDVFATAHREIQKTGAWVLCFDITDYTGSVRVSKYLKPGEDRSVIDKIQKGMRLTVSGTVSFNRYDDDIALEPKGIAVGEKPKREDTAEEKRAELHLHTRFSTMDALTDPSEAVKTAARWGHPAIAITDHGVAHAFPEAWNAAKKLDIKVIYGLEGYLVNDVDERPAIHGGGLSRYSLHGETVAFDVETTGLSAVTDRLTEIGAVIYKDGEVLESFNTFVNPGMHIPGEVTRLTGITDKDVFDAPKEDEAVRKFLDFCGGRPLAAHNAEFDVSFLNAACGRCGIAFDPVYIDTLALSQTLNKTLRRHSLDSVAKFLGLPEFRHHRASDDALVVARIMREFIQRLGDLGAETLDDVAGALSRTQGKQATNRGARHITLLAKNKTGLKNLYKLISKSHLDNFYRYPLILKSELIEHRDGIIVGSACESGEVFNAIVRGRGDRTIKRLASFYDYLEIQPICNNAFLVAEGIAADDDALRDLNRRVLELGRSLDIPVCATGDTHFLEPEDEVYRKILLGAKDMEGADRELPLYLKTTDEMLAEFSYLGEDIAHEVVITNTNAIADMCEEFDLLPKELYTPKIENSAEDLEQLVDSRMRELYGNEPPAIVKERVETEMRDIIRCRYDVIYTTAQKLVSNSMEAGYLVGSRGSVGSSIVAYLSGITEVNSLPAHYRCPNCKHSDFESGKGCGCGADMPDKDCPMCGTKLQKDGFDIPFETFLGFDGDKIPDIDLNFSGEYQARAHKYTEELFGRDHVYRAGTIGTLADKTAFGFVKKYLEKRSLTVTRAEENRLIQGCVGVKRTTGQHPGGLVIIPQDMDVTDFCPVQHPADSKDSGVITTHFEYHSMEDNLLKLDELGHDDPTMIKMLEDMTGLNAREITLDDPETRLIFKSPEPLGLPGDDPIIGGTGTIGIPEFGTGFTRGMLMDTMPEEFSTLVRLSGFSHGTDVWLGNAKELILSGTASIGETIGCRDDIMLYLISKGMDERLAFKIMESVRKGRGLTNEWESAMEKLKVPGWYIDSCKKIKYLFPKAHAVAYVMMAFRIAWFKVHRPLEYYSAHFYRRADSFDAALMTNGVETVRKKILELKGTQEIKAKEQDVLTTLESVYEFYLRGFDFERIGLYESDATRFIICEDKRLRPPFTAIAGLGETAANDLVAVRNGRRFVSREELQFACSKVSQAHMAELAAQGALGDMPETSQMSLF